MSNPSDQLSTFTPPLAPMLTEAQAKNKFRREKLANFFFDLAKLVFAGLVVGSVTPIFTDKFQIVNLVFLLIGALGTYILAIFANELLK